MPEVARQPAAVDNFFLRPSDLLSIDRKLDGRIALIVVEIITARHEFQIAIKNAAAKFVLLVKRRRDDPTFNRLRFE